jgi:ParB family chromosome partitioning protein
MGSSRLHESSASHQVLSLPVSHLIPPSSPVRTIAAEDGIGELTSSLARQGVLQPLVVRAIPGDGERYEVVAGDRRRRAAIKAGLSEVPCIVYDADSQEAVVIGLIENIQRNNLHPLDEAWAYDRLIEAGIARNRAEIARRLGVSRARITQRMELLKLDESTKRQLVEHGALLSEYHARLLLKVGSLDARHQLADKAASEGLSGRQLRALVEEVKQQAAPPRRREREATGSVRLHRVSIPGLRVHIDYRVVDAARALEVLHAVVERLERLYLAEGPDEAAGGARDRIHSQ